MGRPSLRLSVQRTRHFLFPSFPKEGLGEVGGLFFRAKHDWRFACKRVIFNHSSLINRDVKYLTPYPFGVAAATGAAGGAAKLRISVATSG